eukprot:TRINITY_DN28641_c0_g1_i1.p1 TRINITY_DN28641_c0_g1~~TRINITY_DN28641_c0_g1_i1.p1  ORF type:complete len:374 (+),score=58.75 TRINITY_DN28641_c0_g1_i1:172-1293(+)
MWSNQSPAKASPPAAPGQGHDAPHGGGSGSYQWTSKVAIWNTDVGRVHRDQQYPYTSHLPNRQETDAPHFQEPAFIPLPAYRANIGQPTPVPLGRLNMGPSCGSSSGGSNGQLGNVTLQHRHFSQEASTWTASTGATDSRSESGITSEGRSNSERSGRFGNEDSGSEDLASTDYAYIEEQICKELLSQGVVHPDWPNTYQMAVRHAVMLKNLPYRCKQQEVLDAIQSLGFTNTYLFFCLPLRRNKKQNYGFACLSFVDAETMGRFCMTMDGYCFSTRRSTKIVSVSPAQLDSYYQEESTDSCGNEAVVPWAKQGAQHPWASAFELAWRRAGAAGPPMPLTAVGAPPASHDPYATAAAVEQRSPRQLEYKLYSL